jgi:hypothetical protein
VIVEVVDPRPAEHIQDAQIGLGDSITPVWPSAKEFRGSAELAGSAMSPLLSSTRLRLASPVVPEKEKRLLPPVSSMVRLPLVSKWNRSIIL